MAAVHGKNGYIMFGGIELTGLANEFSVNEEAPVEEVDAFGIPATEAYGGHPKFTLEIKGYISTVVAAGTVLHNALNLNTSATFSLGPQGSGVGNSRYNGTVVLTAVSITTPVAGIVGYSLSGKNHGSLALTAF